MNEYEQNRTTRNTPKHGRNALIGLTAGLLLTQLFEGGLFYIVGAGLLLPVGVLSLIAWFIAFIKSSFTSRGKKNTLLLIAAWGVGSYVAIFAMLALFLGL